MTLSELHDQMLANMPTGAVHDKDTCSICVATVDPAEGGIRKMSDKTYSDAEVQALVQAEVAKAAALKEELDAIKDSENAAAIEARIAEARAEAEAKVADLQAKLDEAVIQAEAATKDKDELVAWLEAEKTLAEEAAAVEARRDERVTRVSEVASFPEEYVTQNADRWAGMEEEAFEALLVDYKAVAEKASMKPEGKEIPQQTAMVAARETGGEAKGNAYREVFALRNAGIDPRSI